MDYIRKQHMYLSIVILIVSSTCHALLDRFQEENSDQMFPRHLNPDDDSPITSCDFESLCLWTLSNHSDQSDWSVVSPQQPEKAQVGVMPGTDHSEGSSDGHFLLLSSSSTAEASGRSEYHLTSPVLSGSSKHCTLQVALYESHPASGNLTLLIQPVLSDAPVHSVAVNRESRDDRRAEWVVVESVIGQVDEPFEVTLLYTSSLREGGNTVALDSLELIDCESDHQDAVCGDYYHCVHSEDCIDPSLVCNFHTDCPYGEDEGFIC
ncbi:unnamed protein product, partial [Pleuronectes platessa]